MAACRLVVLEFGLGLEFGLKSIFAGVGLGLGKFFCNQVHFQFSLVLFGPYDIWPTHIVHTTKKSPLLI